AATLSLPRGYGFVTPRISTKLMGNRQPDRIGRAGLAALGELDCGTVPQRLGRRQYHAFAGAEAAQDLALGAGRLAERDAAPLHLAVGEDEHHALVARRAHRL